MKKILSDVFTIGAVAILVWFAISYFDIIANNLDGAQYADWNLIVKLLEMGK